MAEAIAVVGAVAAFTQLLKYSFDSVDKLTNIISNIRSAPHLLRGWNEQISLLLSTVASLEIDRSLQDRSIEAILRGCKEDAIALQQVLGKLSNEPLDGKRKRWRKALKTIQKGKDVRRILDSIKQRRDALCYYLMV